MLTYFSIKRFTLGHHHAWQVCVRARFWTWNSYPLGECVHFQRTLNSVEPIFKTYCHSSGWCEKIWWQMSRQMSLHIRSEASCNTLVLRYSLQTWRDVAFPRDAPWLSAEKSLALGAVRHRPALCELLLGDCQVQQATCHLTVGQSSLCWTKKTLEPKQTAINFSPSLWEWEEEGYCVQTLLELALWENSVQSGTHCIWGTVINPDGPRRWDLDLLCTSTHADCRDWIGTSGYREPLLIK